MLSRTGFTLIICALLLFIPFQLGHGSPLISYQSRFHPVQARHGMVVTQEALATKVGLEILKRGGNAIDAAVASAFTLAVTLPKAGNLAGGGFMLIHSQGKKPIAIDFRETAPLKSNRKMFQDENAKVIKNKSRFHPWAVGVPGTVAGLSHVLDKYGTMKLKDVLRPAIALAEGGFMVTPALADDLRRHAKHLTKNNELNKIFYSGKGTPPEAGTLLNCPDLAATLKTLADKGAKDFYQGTLAKKLVDYMISTGGLIRLEDLKSYRVIERPPVHGSYRGFEIVSMPPPSSGGIHLIQMINILENFNLSDQASGSAAVLHLLTESMRRAYADRSKHLGDPDFTKIPQSGLLSKKYGRFLSQKINPLQATLSGNVTPGNPQPYESEETTHASILDQKGNAVSMTLTLNFSFGSRQVVPGTGILLNNEMDDFSAKPGSPNAFGLVGGEANAVQPRKRPLSSMTPTFVYKNGMLQLITGSPGGSKIITTVLQLLLNCIEYDMNIAEATAMPRIHHQWLPDVIYVEKDVSPDTLTQLKRMGHRIEVSNSMGSTQSIWIEKDIIHGSADPRRPGALALGY